MCRKSPSHRTILSKWRYISNFVVLYSNPFPICHCGFTQCMKQNPRTTPPKQVKVVAEDLMTGFSLESDHPPCYRPTLCTVFEIKIATMKQRKEACHQRSYPLVSLPLSERVNTPLSSLRIMNDFSLVSIFSFRGMWQYRWTKGSIVNYWFPYWLFFGLPFCFT